MKIFEYCSLESVKKDFESYTNLDLDQKIRDLAKKVLAVKAFGAIVAIGALISIYKSTNVIGWNRIAMSPVSFAINVAWIVIAHDCVIIAQNIYQFKKNPTNAAVDAAVEVTKKAATDVKDKCIEIGSNVLKWFSGNQSPPAEKPANQESYSETAEKRLYESVFVKDTIFAKRALLSCLQYEIVQKAMDQVLINT